MEGSDQRGMELLVLAAELREGRVAGNLGEGLVVGEGGSDVWIYVMRVAVWRMRGQRPWDDQDHQRGEGCPIWERRGKQLTTLRVMRV